VTHYTIIYYVRGDRIVSAAELRTGSLRDSPEDEGFPLIPTLRTKDSLQKEQRLENDTWKEGD
jgi:hypothetical protein